MATLEGLTADVDLVIQYFNTRRLDLPDGFFDRKTQFVINGAPFETLLGQSPNDPLILMLSRGPAGYRFTIKALQHAIEDAKIERGDIVTEDDPLKVAIQLWLSGKLRGTGSRERGGRRDVENVGCRPCRDRRGDARARGARQNSPRAALAVMQKLHQNAMLKGQSRLQIGFRLLGQIERLADEHLFG